MSFADRFTKMMERPSDQNQDKDSAPFMLKYGARIAGTVGGFLLLIASLFSLITFSLHNAVLAVLSLLFAFVVIVSEAPFCCMFVNHVNVISDWLDAQPKMFKAVAYTVISFVLFILGASIYGLIYYGLIFVCGLMYGVMVIGKKGDINAMTQAASQDSAAGRIRNIKQNLKAKLIQNAVSMSFTGLPNSDSIV